MIFYLDKKLDITKVWGSVIVEIIIIARNEGEISIILLNEHRKIKTMKINEIRVWGKRSLINL